MNDTPKEITEFMRRKLLALSGSERVLIGSSMFDSARTIILSSLPAGISDLETKRQLCLRLYGNEVNVAGFVASLTQKVTSELDNEYRKRSDRMFPTQR